MPSQNGAIVASAKTDTIGVQAAQKGAMKASKKGKLHLKLSLKGKGEATITAMNESLGIKAEGTAKAGKTKATVLDVMVPEGASAGDHELTVVIRLGEEELRLQVPVKIE